MSDFLVYWRPTTMSRYSGSALDHASGNQFRSVAPGDTLWITSKRDRDWGLIGRIRVGKVVGQQEAERLLGIPNLWQADYHVIAEPGTEMPLANISINDLAEKLRFLGTPDRLTVSENRVNPQQLQSVRRLSTESASLLASRLDLKPEQSDLINTASKLEIGRVYSRNMLAEMFAITDSTIKNGVFRPKKHDSIWLFITEDKTSDRTQYVDSLEGDVLRFEGQTEGKTDALLIGHEAAGLDVLVFYRQTKNEFSGYGFRYEGPFFYVGHVKGRPTRFKFQRREYSSTDSVIGMVERLTGGRTSQGISISPKMRRAIEEHAMARAKSYYQSKGYAVEDVHASKPVDFIVSRADEILRVEVKGTQTAGDEILLTPGEVRYAQQHAGQMMLFIVSNLEAEEQADGEVMIAGGVEQIIRWDIDEGTLEPVGYRYRPVPVNLRERMDLGQARRAI